MKLFCSFAQTGEDDVMVRRRMERVVATLERDGHEVYCILFDEKRQTLAQNGDLLQHALAHICEYDAILAIVTSPRRSEGMLMELGAAPALDKPIYLLQHVSAEGTSYLPEIAKKFHTWSSEDDLINAIEKVVHA